MTRSHRTSFGGGTSGTTCPRRARSPTARIDGSGSSRAARSRSGPVAELTRRACEPRARARSCVAHPHRPPHHRPPPGVPQPMAEPSKQAHAPRARDGEGRRIRLCIDGVPIGVACAPGERKDGESGVSVSLWRARSSKWTVVTASLSADTSPLASRRRVSASPSLASLRSRDSPHVGTAGSHAMATARRTLTSPSASAASGACPPSSTRAESPAARSAPSLVRARASSERATSSGTWAKTRPRRAAIRAPIRRAAGSRSTSATILHAT